jgi:hypothetical protein
VLAPQALSVSLRGRRLRLASGVSCDPSSATVVAENTIGSTTPPAVGGGVNGSSSCVRFVGEKSSVVVPDSLKITLSPSRMRDEVYK